MFYGRGAGRFPTASACMGDIIDVMRNIRFYCTGRIGCGCYRHVPIEPMEETVQKYFLRMQVVDRPGVLAAIASVLGEVGVSIKQVVQKPTKAGQAELVLITDQVKEKDFLNALMRFKSMTDMIQDISSLIRVHE